MTDAADEKPKSHPPGSPEAMAEYRKLKAEIDAKLGRGRRAILDEAEEWRPSGPPAPPAGGDGDGGGDDGDGDGPPAGGDAEEDAYRFDHVRIPRFFGTTVRYVPISMPEAPPVRCLGKNGRTYFYLSPLGELVALTDGEHGQAHIEGLWAPEINTLHRAFPQFNQQRQFKGFQAQYARSAMMGACGLKGIFDVHDKVRGRGCWKHEDGRLIQHLGDVVMVGDEETPPGEIGRHVYPGRPPIERPAIGGRDACHTILARLEKWNWARPVDARLLLGQYCSIILGGALEWRPMGFITGDKATGKSTLQRFGRGLLGRRMMSTVDASEAALRGLLGQDSVGVSFDEIEADAQNDKAQQVMKLARTAASGDEAHRSSASQDIRSFTLRGSFLFSAIIPPSMRPQDMQRMTFFRLHALPKDARLAPITAAETRDLGAGLTGRITGQWHRWDRTLALFVGELEHLGHEQRGALQFGTLLAGAWIALHDHDPDADELTRQCAPLRRDALYEYENTEPVWLQAWRVLLSAQPEVWRSLGFPSVAEMVRKYLTAADRGKDGEDERKKAHDNLTRVGLAIVRQRATGRVFLAVPPRHQGIAAIFAQTDFAKKGGGEGAWTHPMRGAPRVEGSPADRRGVLHVEKVPRLDRQKCTLFWLDGMIELDGEWIPIFERGDAEDEIEAEPPERLDAYLAALRACRTRDQLTRCRDLARALRDRMELEDPGAFDVAEALFNELWLGMG